MSFLTDLFKGNFSNLGNDLAPSNLFSDFGSDASAVLSNPLADAGIAAGIALPFLAPELGAALGIGGAAAGAAGAAAEGGISAADWTTAGLDLGTIGPGATAATDATTALGYAAPSAVADSTGVAAIDSAITTPSFAQDATADQLLAGTGVAGNTAGNFTGAATSAAPGAGSTSFLSSIVSGAEKSITTNPLGIALAGGGLVYDLLAGNKTDPNQAALQAEAPQLLQQGTALTQSGQNLQTYLTSGTLPPALQAQVTQSVAAAKANIIANAAANGQNTNPTQNSQLAADLAAADQNGLVLAGQLEQNLFSSGTQLLQTGVNETGLSEQIYETLVNIDQKNNQQIMTAIAGLASALGGGTKLNIGTSGVTLSA